MSFHANLVNDFELSKKDQDRCSHYYLLHWSVPYLFQKLHECDGNIEHNGYEFIPVLKSETMPLDSKAQVRVSFRVADWQRDPNIPHYVLIKAM